MPYDFLAIHVGQAEIEKNQIRTDRLNFPKSFFSVADWIDDIACWGQYDTESLLDRLLIVNNEDSWTSFFHRSRLSETDRYLSFEEVPFTSLPAEARRFVQRGARVRRPPRASESAPLSWRDRSWLLTFFAEHSKFAYSSHTTAQFLFSIRTARALSVGCPGQRTLVQESQPGASTTRMCLKHKTLWMH